MRICLFLERKLVQNIGAGFLDIFAINVCSYIFSALVKMQLGRFSVRRNNYEIVLLIPFVRSLSCFLKLAFFVGVEFYWSVLACRSVFSYKM